MVRYNHNTFLKILRIIFDVDHFSVSIEFVTKLLCFMFWFWLRACEILAPDQGLNPILLKVSLTTGLQEIYIMLFSF